MKLFRTIAGISIFLSSATIAYVITKVTSVTEFQGVALTSIICFLAGCWFMSGLKGRWRN